MENLNAEQIKKALECYVNFRCGECPLDCAKCEEFDCVKQALALINSQEQRIKELTEENDKLYHLVDDKIQENKRIALLSKATAEVSKTVRNEVIDEFADMVKAAMREVATGKRTSLVGIGWLDQIVKELKGE
jgi:ribosomal protein S17E